MTSLDQAYETFLLIKADFEQDIVTVSTEEDVKIRLITRLFTECLGWSFSSISAERKHENGFSDYLISLAGKNCILIEAKRVGSVAISTTEKNALKTLKLNGPGLVGSKAGINQAASYAQPNGVPIAVLTDGVSWIIFKPTVSGEDFADKQAFVFPSLAAIDTKFSTYFDLLSKESFGKKLHNQMFDDLHNTRTLLNVSLSAAIPKISIFRQQKSQGNPPIFNGT